MLKKLFSKTKTYVEEIHSPLTGKIIDISDVPDPVFSQKMIGDGVAIIPSDGTIFSPVKGEIVQLFPTKHAIGIKSENGLEILIHMGLNTVELKGEGFEAFVKVGQKVQIGDTLIKVDLHLLKEKNIETVTPMVITNLNETVEKLELLEKDTVNNGELILSCYLK